MSSAHSPSERRSERLQEIHRTFALFDRDGDGCITAAELGEVLNALGQPTTPTELMAMVRTVDLDDSGTIEFNEFMALLLPTEETQSDAVADEDLRSAFDDIDRNGDGRISVAELRGALRALGEHVSVAELDAMIERADTDGDGHVNFEEFARMMVAGWFPRPSASGH